MQEPATRETSGFVYIFIDYSNVILEGWHELCRIKKEYISKDSIKVDFGRFVKTVRGGRKLRKVFIAGSTPYKGPTPPNDKSSWERAKDLGYNVGIYRRNALGKEKKVDVHLTCKMMNIIHDEKPGTLVLVSGDSDFSPLIEEAKKKKWDVEIWSWPRGMAKNFKSLHHVSLKDHYKSFIYITGTCKKKNFLEISDDIIKSWRWKDEPIMEYFCTRNLLCQFRWVNDTTAHLYFDNEDQLKEASDWWLSKERDKMPHKENLHTNTELSDMVVDLPQQIAENRLVHEFFNGVPSEDQSSSADLLAQFAAVGGSIRRISCGQLNSYQNYENKKH